MLCAGRASSRRFRVGLASPISAAAGLCSRPGSSWVGIDADDLDALVDAPLPELHQHARADAQHHVGLAPQLVAERQRHAERIAAVEHAAAAPIAEHRRLQHGGEGGDFFGRALRAAAATIIGFLAAPSSFAALRIAVSSSFGSRTVSGGCGATVPVLPQTSMAH